MMLNNLCECIFCKNYKEKVLSYWVSTINNTIVDSLIDKEDAILYESEHFYVVPDIAPLTTGHLLIISKNHIRSMTELSRSMSMELRNVVNTIDSTITCDEKKNIIHFEHGSGNNSYHSLKSINHFHLHCVPLDIDISILMQGYEKCFYKSVNDFEDVAGLEIEDYIYCDSFGIRNLYLLEKSMIESQLLRKLIYQYDKQSRGKALLNDYDWKKDFNAEAFRQSKEYLDKAFGGNRK